MVFSKLTSKSFTIKDRSKKKPASVRLKDFNCFPEFEKLLNYHLMFLQRGIKTKKVKHGAPKLKQKTVASSFILIPRETFFFKLHNQKGFGVI